MALQPIGDLGAERPEPELVAEPITGWRMWSIAPGGPVTLDRELLAKMADAHERGDNPFVGLLPPTRLSAIGVGPHVWPAEPEAARCITSAAPVPPLSLSYSYSTTQLRRGDHEAPHRDCGCGYWALASQESLAEHFAGGPPSLSFAFGEVELWGKLVEFERGYRAQYARPVRVWVVGATEEQREEIADYYGCEVEMAEDIPGRAEAAERVFDRHVQQLQASGQQLQAQLQAMSPPPFSGGMSLSPPQTRPKRHNGKLASLYAVLSGVDLGLYFALGHHWLSLAAAVVLALLTCGFLWRWLNEVPA